MTLRIFLFLIITGCIFSTSCNNHRVFDSYNSVPENTWQKDSAFAYSVAIADSAQHYNIYFNLRNSVDYSYSNIWLFVSIAPPRGPVITDTIEFVLANPAGKWYGTGSGKLRDNNLLYRKNVYFPNPGNYVFKIQHGMRNEFLDGINDFGIRVEKVK